MRADSDNNIDVLRQKSRILERENLRLTDRLTELLRANLALRGMSPEMIELNLPGVVAQAKAQAQASSTVTKKSERRGHDDEEASGGKPKQRGHGPTAQPELKIVEEKFLVKAADKACGVCGKTMEPWTGKDDVVDVVHRIPAQWIIKRCTLEKCRCPEGCSIVTADGPTKLISGGRYTLDVALMSCIASTSRSNDKRSKRRSSACASRAKRCGISSGRSRSFSNRSSTGSKRTSSRATGSAPT